jgi:hypothetical protein
MLNMIDTQDKLKNFSEDQLVREMQMPSGSAPQFMVLGEIERRKRMRADAQKQEGLMQPTVAQEAVNGAGVPQQGVAGLAQSLAPQTDMTQNTGVGSVQEPVRMADGGMLSAGTISAIAQLKVSRPDIYARVKDDPEELKIAAEYFLDVAKDPEMTGLESLEAPRENDFRKRMFSDPSNRSVSKQQAKDAVEFGADYALDQREQGLGAARSTPADDMLFTEGSPAEYVSGTSGPTPGGIVGGSMFSAPELLETDDTSRPYFPIAPQFDGIQLPSAVNQIKTPSGFGEKPMSAPVADAAADVSQLTDEQARRLYLSGRDYEESDVPAIVGMLNREREFQQSDTSTPREEIYDLGPRGRLKYEMDDASPIEKYHEFNAVSNRLAREAAADEQAKSERFFTAQDIAADNAARQPIGPAEGIGTLKTAEEAAQRAAEAAEATQRAANIAESVRTGGGGGNGGSAGTTSAAASKIGEELTAREKAANQDKWLALAQAGFTLMSTGDFGKAGQTGIAAYSAAKKGERDYEMDMAKLQSELALREAQTGAANRSGRGGGGSKGLSANQLLSRGNDLLKSGQAMLENAGDDADAGAEAQAIMAAGRSLIRQAIGGAAPAGPTVTKTPSAT